MCGNIMPESSLNAHMEKKHPSSVQWNTRTVEKVTNVERRYSPYKRLGNSMQNYGEQRHQEQHGLYLPVETMDLIKESDDLTERERIGNISITTFSSRSSNARATGDDQYTFQVHMREEDVNDLMGSGKLFFKEGKLCYKNI